jgi:acyl-CoA thioester hydrolase
MEETGYILPVTSIRIHYKKPAVYDQLITIRTHLRNIPTVRISFDYEIESENGEILATAHTDLAFLNSQTRRPVRCPEYILDKLRA